MQKQYGDQLIRLYTHSMLVFCFNLLIFQRFSCAFVLYSPPNCWATVLRSSSKILLNWRDALSYRLVDHYRAASRKWGANKTTLLCACFENTCKAKLAAILLNLQNQRCDAIMGVWFAVCRWKSTDTALLLRIASRKSLSYRSLVFTKIFHKLKRDFANVIMCHQTCNFTVNLT